MENNRFTEKGNAKAINDTCFPASNLLMFRYETIATLCMDEPVNIFITEKEGNERLFCEPIFKIIIERDGVCTKSYTIYSNKRERFRNKSRFILRRMIWDRKSDKEHMLNSFEEREKMLLAWPTIETENLFLTYNQARDVLRNIKSMDKLIKNGVCLDGCDESISDWTYFELRRRYDWGETRTWWDCTRQNQQIESLILETVACYEDMLQNKNEYPSIEKIELDYMVPLETQKKYICGEYALL